jgi:hypothetical protein
MFVPHRKHITSPLRAQQVNAIYSFLRTYINITIAIAVITHRTVLYVKQRSETELSLLSGRTY